MNVLLTGSQGYLGGWVLKQLQDNGHKVHALRSRGVFVQAQKIIQTKSIDVFIHLAWHAVAGNKFTDEQAHSERVARSLFKACKDLPLEQRPHIIFPSTLSIYGPSPAVVDEATTPLPTCAYTKAKIAMETWLLKHYPQSCILRLGSLMGLGKTRTRTDLVVNAFAADAYSLGKIECWHPRALKPVLHVQNAASFIELCVATPWTGVLNVYSHLQQACEIARLVELQTGCAVKMIDPPQQSGFRDVNPSNKRFLEKLKDMGHDPVFKGIPEAIREFQSFRPNPQTDKTQSWFPVTKLTRR